MTATPETAPLRALVTGGAGFLGHLVVQRLLAADEVVVGGGRGRLEEVVVVDLAPPVDELARDPRVRVLVADLEDLPSALAGAVAPDLVVHLASVVSSAAEADLDLGMRTNLDGTRAVLDHVRGLGTAPVLVFASSLAVFGTDPAVDPVDVVEDVTLPRPQSSYGTQKLVGELLVADSTRRGDVRGRSVRLMTVSVRPGRPNAAASSFLSGIVREPLAGLRAMCPVPAGTPVALSSPRRTVDGILRAAAVDDATWGSRTALTLPALTTTPQEMVDALDLVAGEPLSELVDWGEDEAVGKIVQSWPARFRTDRAAALGLEAPASFDEVLRDYVATLDGRGGRS